MIFIEDLLKLKNILQWVPFWIVFHGRVWLYWSLCLVLLTVMTFPRSLIFFSAFLSSSTIVFLLLLSSLSWFLKFFSKISCLWSRLCSILTKLILKIATADLCMIYEANKWFIVMLTLILVSFNPNSSAELSSSCKWIL